jgi:uncharacterized protein YdhG (YjbR/CyaY superfamily)
MQSTAADVDAYLAEVPPERRECTAKLRQLCKKILKGYEESMQYGMPCYRKGDKGSVAFASQKNYIALYILKQSVLDAHRDQLAGLSVGKGCIRYTRPERIDFGVVESLLKGTVKSKDAPC